MCASASAWACVYKWRQGKGKTNEGKPKGGISHYDACSFLFDSLLCCLLACLLACRVARVCCCCCCCCWCWCGCCCSSSFSTVALGSILPLVVALLFRHLSLSLLDHKWGGREWGRPNLHTRVLFSILEAFSGAQGRSALPPGPRAPKSKSKKRKKTHVLLISSLRFASRPLLAPSRRGEGVPVPVPSSHAAIQSPPTPPHAPHRRLTLLLLLLLHL